MMAEFSPVTRRIVAVGLLIAAIFLALNLLILPIGRMVTTALDRLADSRFQRARLEAAAARPEQPIGDPVPLGLVIAAPNREAAAKQLSDLITAAAARAQLEIQSIAPAQVSRPAQVSVSIAVVGPHDALLGFVNELERGQPLIRFDGWSISAATAAPGAPPVSTTVSGTAPPAPAPAPIAPSQPVRLNLNATVAAAWGAGT